MDILVRFWQSDKVVTRYIGSEVLGSGKAEDLMNALKASLAVLDVTYFVRVFDKVQEGGGEKLNMTINNKESWSTYNTETRGSCPTIYIMCFCVWPYMYVYLGKWGNYIRGKSGNLFYQIEWAP